MGSQEWRERWGTVDFPGWDRDIITLRAATQKSPSSVPRLVSANCKTHAMTFRHGKKKSICCFFFLSLCSKDIRWGVILVLGALLSSTDYPLRTAKLWELPGTCVIFCTWCDDPAFMGSAWAERCSGVQMKQSASKEITVLMNLFKCQLHSHASYVGLSPTEFCHSHHSSSPSVLSTQCAAHYNAVIADDFHS